jgi:hypothetical protein
MTCTDACTVTGSTFRANVAKRGGALLLGGSPVMSDSSILDNVTSSDGGGIFALNVSANAKLSKLVFRGNRAPNASGGAIRQNGGSLVISNGLFVGNFANAGGAIADESDSGFTCFNCTITGNLAINDGHAIRWLGGAATSGPKLSNSIVWGNPSRISAAEQDVFPPNWADVGASHSDIRGYAGSDSSSFDANPLFVSMPKFFDRAIGASADTTSLLVKAGASYSAGDVIEIGGDGVPRAIEQINGNTLIFSPALAVVAAQDTLIRDWGAALGTLNAHLSAGSPCTDLENKARVGLPDLGVYEYP